MGPQVNKIRRQGWDAKTGTQTSNRDAYEVTVRDALITVDILNDRYPFLLVEGNISFHAQCFPNASHIQSGRWLARPIDYANSRWFNQIRKMDINGRFSVRPASASTSGIISDHLSYLSTRMRHMPGRRSLCAPTFDYRAIAFANVPSSSRCVCA